jgi:hypothetical protein
MRGAGGGAKSPLLGLPAWTEILVNVIGYAGFIGIAIFGSSDKKMNGKR